ncbi:hypothetical protein [Halomonas hibernica]|uniref:hypothetical protein n=1 Tax=Halomonas hibernica TaxID=2591147 RepID=UPI0015563A22|nr:hypothetical protein [Halomonas hibernica]
MNATHEECLDKNEAALLLSFQSESFLKSVSESEPLGSMDHSAGGKASCLKAKRVSMLSSSNRHYALDKRHIS